MLIKIIAIAAAGLIAVVVAAVALVFTGVLPNPIIGLVLDPPEHSARYYPDGTIAYSWASLYPEGGQRDQMIEIWDRLNEYDAFADVVEEIEDEFEDETGLTLEDDIMPWIGAEVSAGLLELSEDDDPAAMVTISVRNHGAAEDFMEDWLDYLEDEEYQEFEEDESGGFVYWLGDYDDGSYALSGEVLIFLVGGDGMDAHEDLLDDVLDLADSGGEGSLAENEEFQEARAGLPERRFASVFFSTQGDVSEESGYGDFADFYRELQEMADDGNIPGWAAASAQWIDQGITVTGIAPNEEEYLQSVSGAPEPARLMPDNAIAFTGISFDPVLDNWRDRLDEFDPGYADYEDGVEEIYYDLYREVEDESEDPPRRRENPAPSDVLDLVLELVEIETGIDLEGDFLDYLGGELILGVEEFDPDDVDSGDESLNAVMMLSYDMGSEEALQDTLDELVDFAEDTEDVEFESVDVGADNDATVFVDDSWLFDSNSFPGFVLNDGYLIFGSSEEALETTVEVQQGSIDDAASLEEYQRASSRLPGEGQLVSWIDLQFLVGLADPWDLELDEEEYEVLEESIGSVAGVLQADEELIRIDVVLTLFPE